MNRNVKIGIFALIALIILCLGVNYLKGADMLYRGKKLYAIYEDVDGLGDASPILFSGYKIGKVRNIDVYSENGEVRFCATLAIEVPIDIPSDSRAIVSTSGILGDKCVILTKGSSDILAKSGDTIQSGLITSITDQLLPIKDKAESFIGHADTTIVGVNRLLSGENGRKLDKAIESMTLAMQNFEKASRNIAMMTERQGSLGSTITDLHSLSESLGRQSSRIDSIMININQLTKMLAESKIDSTLTHFQSVAASLSELSSDLNTSESSIGKLLNEKELYNDIDSTIVSLNRLIIDIKQNPGRYINVSVFGKK